MTRSSESKDSLSFKDYARIIDGGAFYTLAGLAITDIAMFPEALPPVINIPAGATAGAFAVGHASYELGRRYAQRRARKLPSNDQESTPEPEE